MLFCCCTASEKSRQVTNNTFKGTLSKVIIYKTRGDYKLQVPVGLSKDKKAIVSYPVTKDLYTNGKPAIPAILIDNFLLDSRVIPDYVAFLKLTYRQYAELPVSQGPDSLFSMILDNNPLTVLYDCGRRTDYYNLTEDLNNLIKTGNFSKL